MNSRVDDAVAGFAVAYATRNNRNYRALFKAVRGGRIATLEK